MSPAYRAVSRRPRLPGLDLLRLFAVVLVMGRHMPPPPQAWPDGVRLPFLMWIQGGWVGVDLFFVLSGFLVSGLLFTELESRDRLSVGRFYMRRAWKIYPPFFALIAVTLAIYELTDWPIFRPALISELFFVQSYVHGLWDHTWSLAIEEHFYVLLPLTLALILRWNRRSPTPLRPILSVTAVVAIASLAMRLLNWTLRTRYEHLTHLAASHLRMDSLLFGVAISYAYHFHPGRFVRSFTPWSRALMLAGALLLIPPFIFPLETTPFIYTWGLSVLYLGSGMILVGILVTRTPRHPLVRALATLGAYSYSIYLWHLAMLYWGVPIVARIVGRAFGMSLGFGGWLAVYFGGALCLGVVMAKVVELPVLQLRDRWFPSHSPGALAVHPANPLPSPSGAADPERTGTVVGY